MLLSYLAPGVSMLSCAPYLQQFAPENGVFEDTGSFGKLCGADDVIPVMNTQIRALTLLLLVIGPVRISWAHAILLDSIPKVSSTIRGSDLDVSLRFNVRIDPDRSRVRLVKSDGTTSTLALVNRSKPDTLQAHADGLKPGEYKLEWQVLASDGHISRGEIPFRVN